MSHAVSSARDAGLRYVTDSTPGLTRRRRGAGFVYLDARRRQVRDAQTLRRIASLVIPPAWEDVWICESASGHLQAVGRDARGRKQYRYHRRWTAVRNDAKYGRLIAFARALPAIRRRVAADLRTHALSRDRVLALVVQLLEKTCIRIGNDEYARTNGSFGLTTLRDRHVEISGDRLRFTFRAKSGVLQRMAVDDAALARVVWRCQDLPGQTLFQYLDDAGRRRSVGSSDVNAYIRAITSREFSAKDFRTWAGTVMAARELCEAPRAVSARARADVVVKAVDAVAARLGNTRAVARRCYIHPAILDEYLEAPGDVERDARRPLKLAAAPGLDRDERAALAVLERRASAPRTTRAAA